MCTACYHVGVASVIVILASDMSVICRYFVPKTTKQATLMGSEHRRALPFLPFAVVAAIGSVENETDHGLLTRAVCELVAVTNEIFSERCIGGGITGAKAVEVAERAQQWVVAFYQPLLGPSHTTKLHRLAAHLLDEFCLRVNLYDGNTGLNEKQHKAIKLAYKATNKRRDQFVEQLLVNQQVATLLLDVEERQAAAATAAEATSSASTGRRRRPLDFPARSTARQLECERNLPGLCTLLQIEASSTLFHCDSIFYGAHPPRGEAGWLGPFVLHRVSMVLRGMTGCSTMGLMARSTTGKLRWSYSPGLAGGRGWWFGGQRKRDLVRAAC